MPNKEIKADDPILRPKGYNLDNLLSIAERIKRDIASGKIKLETVNMSIYGVEQLGELLVFLSRFASVARAAVEDDGKITIGDAASFVELIFPLISAVTGIQDIPKELSDLDPIEKDELVALVAANLDIYENDEAAVEAALKVIFELIGFLKIVGVVKPVDPGV
jgi:hypothetical protein